MDRGYSPKKTFFTSDIHMSHKNILSYCSRPFKTVEEMNEGLLTNWNKVIPKDGVVFVLGDVSFDKDITKTICWINQLNGVKHLIKGNHDTHVSDAVWQQCFETVSDIKEIQVGSSKKIVLCHYPMVSWNGSHRGSWQLYGHVHGTIPDPKDKYQMDVGVDCNNMKPFTFEQIKANMATKTPALTTGRNL